MASQSKTNKSPGIWIYPAMAALAGGAFFLYQAAVRARQAALKIPGGSRVVILGGGFGGSAAAQELAKLLPDDCSITLIDRNDYSLFTPMLTEVAGGQVDVHHILAPLRDLSERVQVQQAVVQAIDLEAKCVYLTAGGEEHVPDKTHAIAYDHLLVALGSVTNYHDIEGMKDHSFGIKTAGEANAIYARAIELVERASVEADEEERAKLLTFVVAGGGYTGIETLAAVNDLVRDFKAKYESLRDAEIKAIAVFPEERILTELDEHLAAVAHKELEKRGVEIRSGAEVASATDQEVKLKDGQTIPTYFLVWAGGITVAPVVQAMRCAHGKSGTLPTDACFAVKDQPGVWAIGDCAEIPQPDGKPYAPIAQNATREGVLAAQNIAAALRGEEPKPFVYKPIGELALVGKRAGVANVYGMDVSGILAWALWRAVYLAKMPGVPTRIHIALDWLLDAVFGRPTVALPK